jgi:hypothetical protein
MLSRVFVTLALVAAAFAAPIASGGDVTTDNVGSFNSIKNIDTLVETYVGTWIKDNLNNNQANVGVLSCQSNNQKRTVGDVTSGNILSGNSVEDVTAVTHTVTDTGIKDNLNSNQGNVGVLSCQSNNHKRSEGDVTTGNVLSFNHIKDICVAIISEIVTNIQNNGNNNQVNTGVLSQQINNQKRTDDTTVGNVASFNSIEDVEILIVTIVTTWIKDNLNQNQLNNGVASEQVNNQKRGDVTTNNVLSGNYIENVKILVHTFLATWIKDNLNNNQVNTGVASSQINNQ